MTDTNPALEPDDEAVIKPFAATLQEMRRGRLHDEASQALHELIAAVAKTGKSGTFTLQLKVSLQPKTKMLEVADDVSIKKPTADREHSLWFRDAAGNLSRDDHNQPTIPGIQIITTGRKKEAAL